jgi:ADP-L-glycero-D-manno-heptose 6-epimerase
MIIVTGATGFIGSAIVWELNQRGYNDIIAVDMVRPDLRTGILKKKSYKKFLLHTQLWDFLQETSNVDFIVHMGACSSTTEMNREYLREINTEYTQRLFEWCTENKVPFIYASSGAVYGDGTRGFDDQTDPRFFTPLNPYGESKLNFDIWALQQTQTPPLWMGLRFFNVYGPNEYFKQDMSSVVFKAFRQINVNNSLKLFKSHSPEYKDGEQLRDFIYVKDVTRWIGEIIFDKKGYSGIYNMGFGVARTWLDLAKSVFSELGKPMKIEWMDVPENLRPRYQYFTQAKMDRFLSMGFSKPQWSLENGIKDYIQKYLNHPTDPFF